jgi:hypothetical protein
MSELAAAVNSTKPDNFTPTIITKTDDYLYAEYQSPTFGFIDDVEFYFPPGKSTVEYRSASRIGESDGARAPCMPCDPVLCVNWCRKRRVSGGPGRTGDINRKRIRALRKELEKSGWASLGF